MPPLFEGPHTHSRHSRYTKKLSAAPAPLLPARHVLGKVTYPKYSQGGDFFSVVHPKFRCDRQGNYEGMGLVVLPK